MSSSEEYLASLGFDTSDMDQSVNRAISILGHLGQTFDGLEKYSSRAERALGKAGRAAREAGSDAGDGAKEIKAQSGAWDELEKKLSDANAAYREYRRNQLTGESGGAAAPGGQTAQDLLDIEAARSASVTQAIRDEQRRVEEANRLRAQEDRIYNDYLSGQERYRTRVTNEAISDIQRESNARTAAYTEALAEYERLQAAANQGRYSTIGGSGLGGQSLQSARLNNGPTVQTRRNAQADYSAAELKDLGNYYRDLEKSSAAAAREAGRFEDAQGSIIAQRYALYDVATTYGAISAALLVASGYAITTGANFESAFTGVERTSGLAGSSSERLRGQLVDLTTQIPKTFEELSALAGRGGQIGIAGEQLDEFTETIAKFVAVSDTVSETEAAEYFGRLSNLTGVTDFQALASSVALVGVNAAATDQQILKTAQEIAQAGAAANFSAEDIIGLSAAFASLGVPPERARSVIQDLIQVMNNGVAGLNDSLPVMADLLGTTTEEAARLWQTDPAAFIQSFSKALNATDNMTVALDAVGLEGKRAQPVFAALAKDARQSAEGQSVLDKALRDASQGMKERTEVDRQYGLILDDLNSQFMIFVNALNALTAQVTGNAVPGLASLLGVLTGVVNGVREFMTDEDAQRVATYVGVLSTLIGIFFAYRAATTLATASVYALTTAQANMTASGTVGGLWGLVGAMLGYNSAARGAAGGAAAVTAGNAGVAASSIGAASGATRLGNALRFVGRMSVLLGIVQVITSLLTDFRGSMESVAGLLGFLVDASTAAASGMRQLFNSFADIVSIIPIVGGGLADLIRLQGALAGGAAGGVGGTSIGRDLLKGFQGWVSTLPKAKNGLDDINAAGAGVADLGDDAAFAGDGFDGLGDSAAGAAEEVRTLVDYANDLKEVTSRAFEIRFGGGQAMDGIDTNWNNIRQAIEDVNKQIDEYRTTMGSLAADKSIREYWLSVAENYGDALRAGQLRAEIAEIDGKLESTASDLTKAQASNSKTLVGNSQAAIDNRAKILDLVKGYQDQITALASAGLSQAELQARTAQLKNEFIAQATQLGFNSDQLDIYAAAFDDVRVAIERVPRNINVGFDPNPALQALNEVEARARNVAGQNYGSVNIPITSSFDGGGAAKAGRAAELQAQLASWQATYERGIKSGADNVANRALENIQRISQILNSGGYRQGGYTGGGNPWDPAGIVHKREFVLNETGTGMFSRQELEAANRGRRIAPSGGSGSMVFPSVITVELSPYDRQQAAEGKNVTVVVSSDEIARSTDHSNSEDDRRGGG